MDSADADDRIEGNNDLATTGHGRETAEEKVADYVGPVDHGDGASSATESSEATHGDHVTPVDHGHGLEADQGDEENANYVGPVDLGDGEENTNATGEANSYVTPADES